MPRVGADFLFSQFSRIYWQKAPEELPGPGDDSCPYVGAGPSISSPGWTFFQRTEQESYILLINKSPVSLLQCRTCMAAGLPYLPIFIP